MNYIGLWTFIRREMGRFSRVAIQTLVTPWISALLYIFVFGRVVGTRIDQIEGVAYVDFVLPGILMMNIIMSAFMQTAFSLYFQRFARHIEEVLVAPFAYWEMIIGHIVGGVMRAVAVGAGIYIIAVFFSTASFAHVGLFFFYALSVAVLFSFIGLLIGLWAQSFEQLNILNTFVIMPLSFLGGMFNSVAMLPPLLRSAVQFNPFFYFIDGIRYAMIGVREADAGIGAMVIVGSLLALGFLVWHLFRIGYRLRV
ncbi:MAG: ABC transporter permease [Parcubacteria group bacterium Gr01-1014_70]|nr:MAG: ABC transporter permease [Parcubacteria group bacterium Gr01-1014_70]